ncbi:MAG: autotransporter-associated beta strand repeat-containing protein, partial [Planctomycetia bacterium]
TLRYDGAIGEEDGGGSAANLVFGATGAREGTVILGGANTYRGTTTVAAGTLVVNGSLGQGNLTVDSGATLKGSGVINGFTSIQGTHSPGNSPGLETFTNGLTYGSSSNLVWELSANTALSADRGTLYDGINLTSGTLTIDPGAKIDLVFNAALAGGGASTVDWDNPFWGSSQSWKVIDLQSGLWNGGIFTLSSIGNDASGQSLGSSVRSNATFSLRQDYSGVYVEYVIVPEPATVIFAGIGIAMVGWSFRKRRRAL